MVTVDIDGTDFQIGPKWIAAPVLPTNSIVISRTPFTLGYVTWESFAVACKKIHQQFAGVAFVFVDATWDPILFDNDTIVERRQELQAIFSNSKVVVLTAHAQHWYDNLQGIIYFPLFTIANYGEVVHLPRQGRIGCLNRRPTLHRVRLMYELLDQGLIGPEQDVYSVSFANLYHKQLYNLQGSGYEWMQPILETWPSSIATHPDGFPCDYTISHPAWHTGIAIITETEPGHRTIICEKTGKGILSKSCFSVYMADVGYRVLEELGFEPRFFADHAEYNHIEPLIKLCKEIETETDALDYRQQRIQQVEHNYAWFGIEQPDFWRRPWYGKYCSKLQHGLENL